MRGAVVVRVIAAVLAAVVVIAGFVYLNRFADVDHAPSSVANELRFHRPEAYALRFLVTATRLDPGTRTITATVSYVPTEKHLPILDADYRSVLDRATGRLRPEYADLKLTVEISNLSSGTVTVDYPFAALFEATASGDTPAVGVAIPAGVDPVDFPNDAYTLDLALYVTLPPGFTGSGYTSSLVGLAAGDQLGQWHLDTNRLVGDSEPRGRRITAEFSRGWAYWAFVYGVSLMPAVIGLGFAVRTRRRGRVSVDDSASALELAAALIALIALRQVFVPVDISGLTRLDVLLGVQLLVLCWLMAVTYVRVPEPVPMLAPPVPSVTANPARAPAIPVDSPTPSPAERSAPASCQRSAIRDVLLVVLVWLGVLLRQRRR